MAGRYNEVRLHSVAVVRLDHILGQDKHGYVVQETKNGASTESDVYALEDDARRHAARIAAANFHPESYDPHRLRSY